MPVLAILVAAPSAFATVRNSSPGLSRAKWRLVLRSGLQDAGFVANDRYVAFLHGSPGRLTLIDEQTGRRKQLSPPDCASPTPLMFGGPWLMVSCPTAFYNLSSGRWAPIPPIQISSQCQGSCQVVAVGRYWAKIVSDDDNPIGALPYDYYLQNIATGQFEHDPATPGGTVFDDLNAPSGSVPLCPPLRYPSADNRGGPSIGQLTFHGQFALTYEYFYGLGSPPVWRLRRCASNLDLEIADDYGAEPPVASSRAVITTHDGVTLHGWFLPSLRRFTIRPAVGDYVTPVAVTDRTIYLRTDTHAQLWAATLPSPRPRSRR